ncbi:MAG TPA: hypothetical protein VMM12_08510, partial [Longimicrobiales bacterium]|nr:hypothetical protein [Longimicrobiales bacterium]
YLKAHYPADFLAALLNAWPMGFYPPATLVHEARRAGVTVLPPCLRDGQWDCTLEPLPATPADVGDVGVRHPQSPGLPPGMEAVAEMKAAYPIERTPGKPATPSPQVAVRVGWKHIRGLGEKARDNLQRASEGGTFTGVADVVRRAGLSRADALHLARAGAFEAFEPGRRSAAWEALRAAGDTLPLAPARHLPFKAEEMSDEELIFLDYLATGIAPSGHPMEHIRDRLRAYGVAGSDDLRDLPDRVPVLVAGLVVARQHPATAKGTVFILMEDEDGFINVIVPPPVYDAFREVIHHSPFLLIQGRFERENRVLNVVADRFRELRRRPEPAHA